VKQLDLFSKAPFRVSSSRRRRERRDGLVAELAVQLVGFGKIVPHRQSQGVEAALGAQSFDPTHQSLPGAPSTSRSVDKDPCQSSDPRLDDLRTPAPDAAAGSRFTVGFWPTPATAENKSR
jgi:hypothetical protein